MKRRVERMRRNRDQWKRVIDEQERSGLAAKEFCERESVGLASFYQWRRRIRGAAGSVGTVPSFIDMGSVDSSSSNSNGDRSWAVTLELGDGIQLKLSRA